MSKAVRIAINGFGRIGRSFLRALYENGYRDSIQVVLINEPAASEAIAHLLKYDSSHGRFGFKVTQSNDELTVAGDDIALAHETEIEAIDWRSYNVDFVVDCTGVYGSQDDGQRYIKQGIKRVLFSHPGKPDVDFTAIYGVNENELSPNIK